MDYANGKIYKITGGGMTYYGSTTQPLYKRFYKHKQLKCSSKIIIETGEAIIVLVELFPCKSKEELFSRERWFIENNDCINKNIPMRTHKEYRIENADKIKEYKKKYYNENVDMFKEKSKEYRIENADKIKKKSKEYYNENADIIIEKQKEYYVNNTDKRIDYAKQYRIINADKIKEKDKQRYNKNADKIKEKQKQYSIINADKIKEQKKQYYQQNKNKIE